MASTGGRETPPMATFGHFFKNRRFGLHFAGGMGQKFEKKIFRGKPPVMSGEVYRCPMDSPELRGALEKNSTKNRNFREGPGRPGRGRGDIGGTLAPHIDASSPKKITFFHNSNFYKSTKIRTQRGETDPDLFDFRGPSL